MTTSSTPVEPVAEPRIMTPEEYQRVQDSPDFQELRRRFRNFAFPMTAAFIIWYLSFVLLSTYAVGFMSIQVIGNINIGLLLGLGQFVSTFAITWLYIRHANKSLDPVADRIRNGMEAGEL